VNFYDEDRAGIAETFWKETYVPGYFHSISNKLKASLNFNRLYMKKGVNKVSTTQDKQLSDMKISEVLIPAEKVAHVQLNNPLEHALLVLMKSGYAAVPVLDATYKFAGIIGKTVILNEVLGIESFEMERLSEIRVMDAMAANVPTLTRENSLLDGLNASIDHPFVCIVDKDGYFDGILTRRAILKQVKKDIYMNAYKK